MRVSVVVFGSSPRARGTAVPEVRPTVLSRFIPAGAGNGFADVRKPRRRFIPAGAGNGPGTGQFRLRFIPAGAGNGKSGTLQQPRCGSSPRARGTDAIPAGSSARRRFIPAGAGNGPRCCVRRVGGSSPRARGTGLRRDVALAVHPRGRGERQWLAPGLLTRFIPAGAGNGDASVPRARLAVGSSPRARGTEACHLGQPPRTRGSSPRARGTGLGPHADRCACGSSPRARGTVDLEGTWLDPAVHPRGRGERQRCSRDGAQCRFIPAGAGNGRVASLSCGLVRFIPAGAGNGSIKVHSNRMCGSSPRARGTEVGDANQDRHHRFIPAGAGNGADCLTPRSRIAGSSPRARGTDRAPSRPAIGRFIPAGAGNGAGSDCAARAPTGSSPRARGTDVRRNRCP